MKQCGNRRPAGIRHGVRLDSALSNARTTSVRADDTNTGSKGSLMKTKLAVAAVLLAVFLAPSHAQAQANAANYTFSTTTSGSLTNMSSGTTTLINPDQDDLASAVTLIGFDFVFMGAR